VRGAHLSWRRPPRRTRPRPSQIPSRGTPNVREITQAKTRTTGGTGRGHGWAPFLAPRPQGAVLCSVSLRERMAGNGFRETFPQVRKQCKKPKIHGTFT
jgi:hypothetical protein